VKSSRHPSIVSIYRYFAGTFFHVKNESKSYAVQVIGGMF